MSQNPWLPIVRSLAREVDAEDYIYNVDVPLSASTHRRHFDKRTKLIAQVVCILILGALAGQGTLWTIGCRLVSPAQTRLIDAVYRIDPRPERWSDLKLLKRLEYRKEAMDLIENAIATPTRSTYPYLATLTDHPSPVIDPGTGSALLLLARALDGVPRNARGRYIQAIVSVALALDDEDLQSTFSALANLNKSTRKALLAGNAFRLGSIIKLQMELEAAGSKNGDLKAALEIKQSELASEAASLQQAIARAQQRMIVLSGKEAKCTVAYRTCLSRAVENPPQ